MERKPSIWGIGPKLVVSTMIYAVMMFGADLYFGCLAITTDHTEWLRTVGTILVAAGGIIWGITVWTIFKMHKLDHLYRQGLYAYCRHPLYANFIFLLVPGLCRFANSWQVLTTPLFMCFAFHHFIKEEEEKLIALFGDAYLQYRQEVNALLPRRRSNKQ